MKTEPILLGRNDAPVKERVELMDSETLPGMKSVKADTVDRFDTRPGQTLYEGK